MDRRRRKTRDAIRQACLTILEEKSFEAMTIADIAAQADINRGTFYLHFEDKYLMLDQLEQEVIAEVRHAVMSNFKKEELVASRYDVLVHIFTSFRDHRDNLALIFKARGTQSFHQRLDVLFEEMFDYQKTALGLQLTGFIPVVLFRGIVVAINIGIAQYWIETSTTETPEELASAMLNIMINGPARAAGLITEGVLDISQLMGGADDEGRRT